MNRMPVVIRDTGQRAAILDMSLADDAFDSDGLPRNGDIPDETPCWVETDEFGRVSRREISFGELDLA